MDTVSTATLDAWLDAIDRGDQLELPGLDTNRGLTAGRIAGLYVAQHGNDYWSAPVAPASRNELRARLATHEMPPGGEPTWRRNPCEAPDPFDSVTHVPAFVGVYRSDYFLRQTDGTFFQVAVIEWNDDPMGGAFTEVRAEAFDVRAAVRALDETMHRGGYAKTLPASLPRSAVPSDVLAAKPPPNVPVRTMPAPRVEPVRHEPPAPRRIVDPVHAALEALLPEDREVVLTLPSTEFITSGLVALAWGPWCWFFAMAFLRAFSGRTEAQYFAPSIVLGLALVGMIAGASSVATWSRQRNVRVIVDDEGIRETDGGRTRLAIPWKEARSRIEIRDTQNVRTTARYRLVDLSVVAPSGESIRMINHEPWSVLGMGMPFRVYTPSMLGVRAVLDMLPRAASASADARVDRRRGGWLTSAAVWSSGLGMLAAPIFCLSFLRDRSNYGARVDVKFVAALSVLMALLGLLRMTRVLGEAMRIRRVRGSASSDAIEAKGAGEGPYRAGDRNGSSERVDPRLAPEIAMRIVAVVALATLPWILAARIAWN